MPPANGLIAAVWQKAAGGGKSPGNHLPLAEAIAADSWRCIFKAITETGIAYQIDNENQAKTPLIRHFPDFLKLASVLLNALRRGMSVYAANPELSLSI